MQFNTKKICRRAALLGFDAFVIVAVLLVLAASALIFRLTSSPLDIEFARPAIEEALKDSEQGVSVKTRQVVLHWPDLRGPLLLGLRGGEIYGPDNKIVASVDEAALAINKGKLFLGKLSPEGLMLKAPSLSVIRHDDNSFDIGLDRPQTTYGPVQPSVEPSDDIIETVMGALAGEGETGALLADLKSFEIQDAKLVVDDRVLGRSWILPRVDATFSRVDVGLRAELEVEFPSDVEDKPVLAVDALLNSNTQAIELSSELQAFSLGLLAEKIPGIDILQSEDVVVDAKIKAKYDPEKQEIALPEALVTIGGLSFAMGADLKIAEDQSGVRGPVRLSIEELAQEEIAPLWPVALKDDNSAEWVVEKLSKGTFSNMYAQGDLVLEKGEDGWDGDVQKLMAGFEFEGMDVDYRSPLAPVTNAKGKGSFDLDTQTLRIDIEKAKLLDMDITGAELEFVDIIKVGAGVADINVKLNGPLKSALNYVAEEPIEVKPEFDVAGASGQADLSVNIQFPTVDDIKVEDVKIDVRGTLNDVMLPDLVQGLPLSGGPLNLVVKGNEFSASGKGKLSGQDITLDYKEFLDAKGQAFTSKVKATVLASEKLRNEFGVDLSTFLAGPALVDVTYTSYSDGRSQADVKANLTRSKLFVDPFDYEKAPGAKASASLMANLQNGVLKSITGLHGQAPAFKLENSKLLFRGSGENTELASGNISRFVLEETIAGVEFEIAKSGLVKLVMNGPFMDMRPFLDNEGEEDKAYQNPPMQVSVAVDRMRTADEETVQYGKIYADINAKGEFNQLEMDAIAGAGDIYLRFKPDGSGKRVFRFEADDAGATLKAFDLYKNMVGGKMIIYAEPIRSVFDRNLIGKAEITNFKVVDAPGLAQLLGAMSLPGLIQSLNGEGLIFTKMAADFDWRYRQNGSLLVLKDGRTSGNSLGLTFDGTFDNAAQTLDVSGTIIPLSGLNKMIGSIPLVGDILTGGTGAFIAATYKMKTDGPGEEPKVTVNPLAALTPGFLRRILFEEQ